MDSGRARAILQMIQDRQEASVQPSERGELVSRGFLVSVDASTRDGWTASVAGLAALRDRVREMSRVALATPGPVAPPELQQMVASLEELTRQKTNLDFRFAAMILAKRAINPSLLVSAFQMFHHDTNWGSLNKVDRLIGSAILASLPWDPASVRNAFERLRVELEYHGVQPEDRILAAASLADLPQSGWAEALKRIDDLHRGRPNLNFLLASALARSPYEPAEALARFEDALTGMAARGYKDGIHIEAAASLLAAGPMARETMVARLFVAVSPLAGTFD